MKTVLCLVFKCGKVFGKTLFEHFEDDGKSAALHDSKVIYFSLSKRSD